LSENEHLTFAAAFADGMFGAPCLGLFCCICIANLRSNTLAPSFAGTFAAPFAGAAARADLLCGQLGAWLGLGKDKGKG